MAGEIDVNGGSARIRNSRETNHDRARASNFHLQKERARGFGGAPRKLQIVYYLSRNGQLEHPHFMEISHLPNQNLRLRDVIEKLTALRGMGMPSLFSWSCKRSYKNGYVWNDLSENDVIYPADGAEYVLKGSEIIHGCIAQRLQHLKVGNGRPRPLTGISRPLEPEEVVEEDEEEEMVVEAAHHGTASPKASNFRRSRGVSMDEIVNHHPATKFINPHSPRQREFPLSNSSPPSSSSSDKAPAAGGGCTSFRFEDGDPVTDPGLSPSSVLLQLISCGSVSTKGPVAAKGRAAGVSSSFGGFLKSSVAPAVATASRNSRGSLRIGAASRSAAAVTEAELQCISENPRRGGNPQLEEKVYFSGSMLEVIAESGRTAPEPALKKSGSYKEERGSMLGIGEEEEEENGEGGGVVRGKCIPVRKRSSAKQQEQSAAETARNEGFIH